MGLLTLSRSTLSPAVALGRLVKGNLSMYHAFPHTYNLGVWCMGCFIVSGCALFARQVIVKFRNEPVVKKT